MNEQDKQLLERYLKDSRKKKIIFLTIAIFLIIGIIFFIYYANYRPHSSNEENYIDEEIRSIIIENVTNETTTPTNIQGKENITIDNEVVKATEDELNNELVTKEENTSQKVENEIKTSIKNNTTSTENKEKETKEKPENKDFLFVDGYTMDNVTQAAQDYLESYNFEGKCIPLKDSEGVYLGMRVIFY